MENFTPISGLIGGLLIGLAASAYFYFNRKICGISGMAVGCLPPFTSETVLQGIFLLGLLCGGVILRFAYPTAFMFTIERPLAIVFLGGFLVGFGSRLGKGCTSGHGVCGIGRLAMRSIIATILFFITGIITATILGEL